MSFLELFTTASLFSIVCQTTLNNKSQECFQRSIALLSSIVIIATLSSFVWHQTVQPNLIKNQEISNNEGSYPILLWEQSSAIYNYLRWKLILCSHWKLSAQSCMCAYANSFRVTENKKTNIEIKKCIESQTQNKFLEVKKFIKYKLRQFLPI